MCRVKERNECESPAGQSLTIMSLYPGPDHPTTILNADELVALTTGSLRGHEVT